MSNEHQKAQQVLSALTQAKNAEPQAALAMLNGLAGLVQGGGGDSLETDERRASAFLAICEVGKALHRGQPADPHWAAAMNATKEWLASAEP